MADTTVLIKDAQGTNRAVAADLTGGVYTMKSQVTGPVTNAELRASAIPVSGPATNAELRAAPIPVSGPATNAELRATPVDVAGPVTNTELRAAPVPVSGPVTDTQLRAAPVSITDKNLNEAPKTCGVYAIAAEELATITVPAGSTGVRLFAVTKNVVFLTDADPAVPAADTLGAGGVAIAGQLRIYRFPSGPTNLRIRSTEGSGGASTDVVVEFFGV